MAVRRKASVEKQRKDMGEMTPSVKELWCKCKDLSAIPRTRAWRHTLVIPGLGRQRQADPWSSLARDSAELNG